MPPGTPRHHRPIYHLGPRRSYSPQTLPTAASPASSHILKGDTAGMRLRAKTG
ncbi:hypothetical protein H0H81_004306 [Sphagnurus paluster]|uniref:Uncharacterized protein n=1 Tax=Sphagnurus paluster TaxID=117069 RepID=A0A9P7GWK4_9AGAR|nr:hypothetical protein H0H81_004306 [Sphagnurus paluster]